MCDCWAKLCSRCSPTERRRGRVAPSRVFAHEGRRRRAQRGRPRIFINIEPLACPNCTKNTHKHLWIISHRHADRDFLLLSKDKLCSLRASFFFFCMKYFYFFIFFSSNFSIIGQISRNRLPINIVIHTVWKRSRSVPMVVLSGQSRIVPDTGCSYWLFQQRRACTHRFIDLLIICRNRLFLEIVSFVETHVLTSLLKSSQLWQQFSWICILKMIKLII